MQIEAPKNKIQPDCYGLKEYSEKKSHTALSDSHICRCQMELNQTDRYSSRTCGTQSRIFKYHYRKKKSIVHNGNTNQKENVSLQGS